MELRDLESRSTEVRAHFGMTPLFYLEYKSGISASNISKWQKDEDSLVQQAADKVRSSLMATCTRRRLWFPDAEKKLYKMLLARRKRKLRVSTRWITVTFKKLIMERYPQDPRAKAFRPSFRFAQKWATRHSLSKRRRSNSKNKSVEERLPKIRKWHRECRKLLQQPRVHGGKVIPWERQAPVSDGGSVEQPGALIPYEGPYGKWGRFVKELRDNTDQVPLGFVTGQEDTWDKRGAKRVHVGQPFPGLEKRQCTVQPTIGAGGKKTRCAIIFRGKGTGITKVEKAAYDKRVDVFFQPKAWADSDFCM
ncbi:unnamed protein product [Ectocarpus sp. 6 AP-2014]